MNYQRKDFTCGIAAVQNALACLGIKRTQGQLRKLCHSDPDEGTPEEEIKRALLACGVGIDEFTSAGAQQAESWLFSFVGSYGPVLLCVDAWEHWLTVVGVLGNTRLIVFDPARGAGLRVYEDRSLLTRWLLGKRLGGPAYYGIGVSK